MKDECLNAQRIVSETYDGAEVPAAEIQQAREHCERCPECQVFVSTLASVRRIPSPAAPAAAIENAIRAVHEEKRADDAARMAAEAAAASKADIAPSAGPATAGGGSAGPRGTTDRDGRGRWPKWAVYTAWASAAAATLFVAGIVTIQGANFVAGTSGVKTDDAGYRLAEPQSAQMGDEAESSLDAAPAPQAEVSYLTVGGWVYELIGPQTAPISDPTTIATTSSALDTGNAPQTLNVYSIGSSDEIVVDDGDGFLRFKLVSRSFRGATYAMKSRAISSFGQWPALPAEIPEPASADGQPSFTKSVSDDLGTPVFVLRDSEADTGFAIAPGTSDSDPAGGNPNWTWWEQP